MSDGIDEVEIMVESKENVVVLDEAIKKAVYVDTELVVVVIIGFVKEVAEARRDAIFEEIGEPDRAVVPIGTYKLEGEDAVTT
jgi:hypothetical protein